MLVSPASCSKVLKRRRSMHAPPLISGSPGSNISFKAAAHVTIMGSWIIKLSCTPVRVCPLLLLSTKRQLFFLLFKLKFAILKVAPSVDRSRQSKEVNNTKASWCHPLATAKPAMALSHFFLMGVHLGVISFFFQTPYSLQQDLVTGLRRASVNSMADSRLANSAFDSPSCHRVSAYSSSNGGKSSS